MVHNINWHRGQDKRVSFERHSSFLPMPYVPFLSNCKGFSTRIPVFELFEHKNCNLVPPEETVPVEAKAPNFFSNVAAFGIGQGAANMSDAQSRHFQSDSCDLRLECIYDEISEESAAPYTARVEESREKYWFELTQDSPKPSFYFTYDGLSASQLLDLQPHPSETSVRFWKYRKELVPVHAMRNRQFYGLPQQYAPKNVTLTVNYWQETKRRKHLVSAHMSFDAFWRPDFCGGTDQQQYYPNCDCGVNESTFNSTEARADTYRLACTRFEKRGYYLRVVYKPLGYIELFNAVVFPSYVYFAFFVVIAALVLILLATNAMVCRTLCSSRGLIRFFRSPGKTIRACLCCCGFGWYVLGCCMRRGRLGRIEHRDRLTLQSVVVRSQIPLAAAFMLHLIPLFLCAAICGALVHQSTLNLFW